MHRLERACAKARAAWERTSGKLLSLPALVVEKVRQATLLVPQTNRSNRLGPACSRSKQETKHHRGVEAQVGQERKWASGCDLPWRSDVWSRSAVVSDFSHLCIFLNPGHRPSESVGRRSWQLPRAGTRSEIGNGGGKAGSSCKLEAWTNTPNASANAASETAGRGHMDLRSVRLRG